MARYDPRVVAAAIGVQESWLSSILTRFSVLGVSRGRQGRTRTLTREAVLCLAVARDLIADAGANTESALALAHELIRRPDGRLRVGTNGLEIRCDLELQREQLRVALDLIVASAVEVPRGRPRGR